MLPLLRWENTQIPFTNPAPKCQKQIFVPLLILRVCLFLRNRGWGTRQKKLQRSSEYHERVAELEIVHNQALANSPTPSTPPPQLHFVMSPSPPPPPPPHAPRAARRLNITMGSPQTADPAARPRSPSLDRWPGVGHTPSKTSRLQSAAFLSSPLPSFTPRLCQDPLSCAIGYAHIEIICLQNCVLLGIDCDIIGEIIGEIMDVIIYDIIDL
jgi:hypothetical protein